MRRLSQPLAAAGVAMLVACSGDPPTTPHNHAGALNHAVDTQMVAMSKIAKSYLQQLRDGIAGHSLSDAAKQLRLEHVQQFVRSADSAIDASSKGPALDYVPGSEPPSGLTAEDVFVKAGTFTDLCLSCQNAVGFVQTSVLGILTSSTQASIQVDGRSYSPSTGPATCVGAFCLSLIDLSPIVDCRVKNASGTATSQAAYLWRLYSVNVTAFGMTTYDDDQCVTVPPISVSLGASSISVGASTQATASCYNYLQWSSSAPWIASVSNTGVVTGVSAGRSEISATCGANRGSAMISVTYADDPADSCDDPMTPAAESCDDQTTPNDPYSVTYTRPGYYGEADDSWFTLPEFTESYTVVCDVTDWYEWNSDHTAAHYVDTVVNSCWLEPYNGGHHH
jgi:uncharacterized protein YjdB